MSEVNKYITWIEIVPTLGQLNGVKYELDISRLDQTIRCFSIKA